MPARCSRCCGQIFCVIICIALCYYTVPPLIAQFVAAPFLGRRLSSTDEADVTDVTHITGDTVPSRVAKFVLERFAA